MSDDVEMRLTALEARIARAHSEIQACVRELLTDDEHAYLVAERLPPLGSAALPELRTIMRDAGHTQTVRVLAALVGFEVGDRHESLSILLDEIEHGGEIGPLAARRLAERQIRELEPALLAVLATTDASEADAVVSYLEALHLLGSHLPAAQRERLAGSGVWQVTTALSQWHPA